MAKFSRGTLTAAHRKIQLVSRLHITHIIRYTGTGTHTHTLEYVHAHDISVKLNCTTHHSPIVYTTSAVFRLLYNKCIYTLYMENPHHTEIDKLDLKCPTLRELYQCYVQINI